MFRACTSFCLTINKVDWSKSVTGEWFANEPSIKDICVAEEKYHDEIDCDTGEVIDVDGLHHHCYLLFNEPMWLVDVKVIVETLTVDHGYDLQCCKSRKSWLIYITKEDYRPFLKNVRVSELSLYARTKHYFITKYRKPMPISKDDGFLFGVGNYRNLVLDVGSEHIDMLRQVEADKRVYLTINNNCTVSREIVNALDNGKHCYLYGTPGLGKTEIIDTYLRGKKVYRVGEKDRFMFGGLKDDCEFILFDDFNPSEYIGQLKTILAIMDHKPVTISEKFKNDCIKFFKCQCIFISNYNIPSDMCMLLRRLEFFCVVHKMYECLGC